LAKVHLPPRPRGRPRQYNRAPAATADPAEETETPQAAEPAGIHEVPEPADLLPAPQANDTANDQPEATAPQSPDQVKDQPRKPGRPKGSTNGSQQSEEKAASFFDRVNKIPAFEWEDSKACIYVYCTGPICDLKGASGKVYLEKIDKPISDVNRLMVDYGSHSGYLVLNRYEPGRDKSITIDRYDYDIYNINYPPKIPQSVWKNDPRNARWLALLPQGERLPAPQSERPSKETTNGAASLTEISKAVGTIVEISERLADRNQQPQEKATGTRDIIDLAKGLKDLAAPGPKEDNGVMTVLLRMLDSAEKRSSDMMALLLAQLTKEKPAPSNPIEFMKSAFDLVNKIQEQIGEKGSSTKMSGWQEMLQPLIGELPKALTSIASAVAMAQAAKPHQAQQGQPQTQQQHATAQLPAPNGANGAPAIAQQPQPPGMIVDPLKMLLDAIKQGQTGDEFAEKVSSLFPTIYQGMCGQSRDNILVWLQNSPAWAELAPVAPALPKFIDDFLAYGTAEDVDDEEDGEEGKPGQPTPNDLTTSDDKTEESFFG
jgi:hypothetical protein